MLLPPWPAASLGPPTTTHTHTHTPPPPRIPLPNPTPPPKPTHITNPLPQQELRPEDFQIVAVSQVDAEALVLSVEAPVRVGHRLKFVIRERRDIEDDLRDRLLAYKRADLTGMLTVREPGGAEGRPGGGV